MNANSSQNGQSNILIRFVSELMNLVKSVEMYRKSHPVTRENAENCMKTLKEILRWQPEISIFISDNTFMLGDQRVPDLIIRRNPLFRRMQSLFREKQIMLISIDRGVTEDDLLVLASALTSETSGVSPAATVDEALQEAGINSIHVNPAPSSFTTESAENLLLTHFLDGTLGEVTSPDLKNRLIQEILKPDSGITRQIIDKLRREESHNHPVVERDLLETLGEKWIHLLGEILVQLTGRSGLENRSSTTIQLFEKLLPSHNEIPTPRLGHTVKNFLEQTALVSPEEKLAQFHGLWKSQLIHLEQKQDILFRVRNIVTGFVEAHRNRSTGIEPYLKELSDIMPDVYNYTSLTEKVFSVLSRLPDGDSILKALSIAVDAYIRVSNPSDEVSAVLEKHIFRFSSGHRTHCGNMSLHLIDAFLDSHTSPSGWFAIQILNRIIDNLCHSCPRVEDCGLIDYVARMIHPDDKRLDVMEQFIDIWKNAAEALLMKSETEFRRRVIRMAEHPLNPEDFRHPRLRNTLADAWKSFAEAPVFQDMFRDLVSDNRNIRFKTIRELSRYGHFAAWICLGGLDSQDWHLRRNLATVLGQVTDLRYTNILREPLRDPDWHVRWEIINALANRVDPLADELRKTPNHPLMRILCMALRDGNKQIRKTAYGPIERLRLIPALKSLQDLYISLAAINDDADLEERTEILRILARIASHPDAPVEKIIAFIADVAAQKEGIITPGWMIPIKKSAVQALENISHPLAREWIEKLASRKPYKRGIVGREARAALQRLKSQKSD